MSVNRDPILKRCRSLQIDPSHLGIFKESKRTPDRSNRKMSEYGLQLREQQRAKYIYGARQLVVHAHFTVNGKKVNIPSYQVKPGDVIKVKAKSASSPKFQEIKDMTVGVPEWLSVDRDKLEGTVLADPTRDQIDTPVEEHLIVELYSK